MELLWQLCGWLYSHSWLCISSVSLTDDKQPNHRQTEGRGGRDHPPLSGSGRSAVWSYSRHEIASELWRQTHGREQRMSQQRLSRRRGLFGIKAITWRGLMLKPSFALCMLDAETFSERNDGACFCVHVNVTAELCGNKMTKWKLSLFGYYCENVIYFLKWCWTFLHVVTKYKMKKNKINKGRLKRNEWLLFPVRTTSQRRVKYNHK